MRYLFIILVALGLCKSSSAETWCTPSEVRMLADALSVADFPVAQGKLRETLGLHNAHPLYGSRWEEGSSFLIYALTDPKSPNGYYAARLIFSDDVAGKKPEDFAILDVHLMYITAKPKSLNFVFEPATGQHAKILLKIKANLKKNGVSPRQYAEQNARDEALIYETPPPPSSPAAPAGDQP